MFLVEQAEGRRRGDGPRVVEATASNSSEVQAAASRWSAAWTPSRCITDNTAVSALESIVKVCQQNKIPLIAGDTDSVKRGAVAAYASTTRTSACRPARWPPSPQRHADRGHPVEFAQNLQLSVNEKAAAAIGRDHAEDLIDQGRSTSSEQPHVSRAHAWRASR